MTLAPARGLPPSAREAIDSARWFVERVASLTAQVQDRSPERFGTPPTQETK
jgi:hypothetical protein